MNKKTGFLLSYLKYGDNNAILHCFTSDEGFESFFLRGIYTAKNKKKSLLTPLSELFLNINPKKKSGNLSLLNQIESTDLQGSDFNPKTSAILFFTADFLNQVLKNENHQSKIYDEIKIFLGELKTGNYLAHLYFLYRIIKLLGFEPLNEDGHYLDLETGSFVAHQTNDVYTLDISRIWKELISENIIYTETIPQNKSREFLNSLLVYYQFHFESFKTPVSLEIVKELFQ